MPALRDSQRYAARLCFITHVKVFSHRESFIPSVILNIIDRLIFGSESSGERVGFSCSQLCVLFKYLGLSLLARVLN